VTYPVIILGDEIAQNIATLLPEAFCFSDKGCSMRNLPKLLEDAQKIRPDIVNTTNYVICIGTYDRIIYSWEKLMSFRKLLNDKVKLATGRNAIVTWILPVSNYTAGVIIKVVANRYSDNTIQSLRILNKVSKTTTQIPVYQTNFFVSGNNTIWYNKTVTQNVNSQMELSYDNVFPNSLGYDYLAQKLRETTNNWQTK